MLCRLLLLLSSLCLMSSCIRITLNYLDSRCAKCACGAEGMLLMLQMMLLVMVILLLWHSRCLLH